MVYKEWGRETTWKVQQVSHSDSLTCGACRGDKDLEKLLHNSYLLSRHYDFVAHKKLLFLNSQASSKRLDVRNWTFLMRRLCCCGSQSNWHNCKLPHSWRSAQRVIPTHFWKSQRNIRKHLQQTVFNMHIRKVLHKNFSSHSPTFISRESTGQSESVPMAHRQFLANRGTANILNSSWTHLEPPTSAVHGVR